MMRIIRFMKYIKTKKNQFGLTLIMTMVVIAVIGILAEVALLSYEGHVAQEQVIKK
jgi:Tfp pilus assembly protein PilE